MRSPLFPLAAAAALAAGALAQQYAGDVINNTLYTLNGAAINYFKIQDTTSKAGGYGTLLNYYSAPNGNRLIESQVQRVVIVVHGLDEDPWTYWQSAAVGLQNAKALNPAINESTVAIIAPYFANGDGKGTAYPWTAGLAPNKGSVRPCADPSPTSRCSSLLSIDLECTRLVRQSVGVRRGEPVPVEPRDHLLVHRPRPDHLVLQQRHSLP
jgi:hypothetical protein